MSAAPYSSTSTDTWTSTLSGGRSGRLARSITGGWIGTSFDADELFDFPPHAESIAIETQKPITRREYRIVPGTKAKSQMV